MQNIALKSEKRGRFLNRRRFVFVLTASLGVALMAGADPGYLPRVGPVPLRFLPVPAPVTNIFVLPPPAPEPVPVPAAMLPKLDTNAVVAVPDPGAIITEVSSAPPAVEPPRQDEVVSPQMFLKYFNKGSNGNSATVVAPMDFTPPKAPDAAGSKASYSTGP